MDERDDKPESSRRDFLRKLGIGAAVVAVPGVLGACTNPYVVHG